MLSLTVKTVVKMRKLIKNENENDSHIYNNNQMNVDSSNTANNAETDIDSILKIMHTFFIVK